MSEEFLTSRIVWNDKAGGMLSVPLKEDLPVILNKKREKGSAHWQVSELLLGSISLEVATLLREALKLNGVEIDKLTITSTAKLPSRNQNQKFELSLTVSTDGVGREPKVEWNRIYNMVEENSFILQGLKSKLSINWILKSN